MDADAGFRRELTFFDVTNMTVGAIVGADIYVASAITAGLLGPASLLAWVLAGLLATILALCLAECSRLVSDVGGPYAYVTHAFGPFLGFVAGWSMWIAELTALPVFAIAFTNYLGYFVGLSSPVNHTIRLLFLAVLTGVNVVSVRAAGRFNDALTLLKLSPLLLMVVAGFVYMAFHTGEVGNHLSPFAPFGFNHFPRAVVLVFWAYAGFELSTVPSGEVRDPQRTIFRALVTGMLIVTAFYLSTNLVVYSLVDHTELMRTATPLATTGTVLFGSAGATIMAAGAMISVSGSDESDMLGSARLSYAMAADGLLPHGLARLHQRFRTPHIALIAQAALAGVLTFVGNIAGLISFAVVNLSIAFLLCALALYRLQRRRAEPLTPLLAALPVAAALVSGGLLLSTPIDDKLTGAGVLLAGAVVYLAAAPRTRIPNLLHPLSLHELNRRRMRFLGGLVGWLGGHRSSPA